MKVCFVGIGSIAKRHILNLQFACRDRGILLHVDALRRPESHPLKFEKFIDNTYTSISDLPKDYDVIFLTNPTEFHADTLIALHSHSKHFFIEKPISSISTAYKLQDFPVRKDSIYYVACPLRYSVIVRFLKENILKMGVSSFRCISSSYLPEWRLGVDYRETYSAHKDLGGGVDIDLIHEWDYLAYLFGYPLSVKCLIDKVSTLNIDSADIAVYVAKFNNNVIGELHLDYFGRKTIRKLELFTEEDSIVADFIEGKITYLKSGKEIVFNDDREAYQKAEICYFLDMLYKKGKCSHDIACALDILKLTQGNI